MAVDYRVKDTILVSGNQLDNNLLWHNVLNSAENWLVKKALWVRYATEERVQALELQWCRYDFPLSPIRSRILGKLFKFSELSFFNFKMQQIIVTCQGCEN